MRWILTCFLMGFLSHQVYAQEDDLMSMLEEEAALKKEFVIATFKAPRLIQGHTIEQPAAKNLLFIISHRFGQLDGGLYDLFGLDQASIRFGLDYGINDRISIGAGRSTYQKTYDGFTKVKILRQATGENSSPVSLSWLSSISVNTLNWADPNRENFFSSRLAYVHQILLARKMNSSISLQLMPTLVHKNLVELSSESNDVYALGAGGRVKLTDRICLVAETWFFAMNRSDVPGINNLRPKESYSGGIELETGGHVFQFQLTNSQAMFEKGFITETIGDWGKGGIHFGFNITRTFDLRKHE